MIMTTEEISREEKKGFKDKVSVDDVYGIKSIYKWLVRKVDSKGNNFFDTFYYYETIEEAQREIDSATIGSCRVISRNEESKRTVCIL